MKAKLTLLFIVLSAILFGTTSIIRLASSDVLGSPAELAATMAVAVAILVIGASLLIRSFKAKLKNLNKLRSKYDAVYLCMIESDPVNLYLLVSTNTELLLLSNDKKNSVVIELKKKFIDITITDKVPKGFRNGEGLRITTKPGFTEEITPSTYITLLDDTKVIFTPPLKDAALTAAHTNLTR